MIRKCVSVGVNNAAPMQRSSGAGRGRTDSVGTHGRRRTVIDYDRDGALGRHLRPKRLERLPMARQHTRKVPARDDDGVVRARVCRSPAVRARCTSTSADVADAYPDDGPALLLCPCCVLRWPLGARPGPRRLGYGAYWHGRPRFAQLTHMGICPSHFNFLPFFFRVGKRKRKWSYAKGGSERKNLFKKNKKFLKKKQKKF